MDGRNSAKRHTQGANFHLCKTASPPVNGSGQLSRERIAKRKYSPTPGRQKIPKFPPKARHPTLAGRHPGPQRVWRTATQGRSDTGHQGNRLPTIPSHFSTLATATAQSIRRKPHFPFGFWDFCSCRHTCGRGFCSRLFLGSGVRVSREDTHTCQKSFDEQIHFSFQHLTEKMHGTLLVCVSNFPLAVLTFPFSTGHKIRARHVRIPRRWTLFPRYQYRLSASVEIKDRCDRLGFVSKAASHPNLPNLLSWTIYAKGFTRRSLQVY